MDLLTTSLVNRYKTNDPFRIARELNIIIRFANFEDGTRGLYYRVLRRRFIVIHDQMDEMWKRFVCAHELGHDRLHPGLSRFWLDEHSFYNPGKYERQANRFAVHLLTSGNIHEQDETMGDFLRRLGVPEEMHKYY